MQQRILRCGVKTLDLSQPHVMGILNVTPDSFSDGGQFISITTALQQARNMVADGATLIDVGGESTRPGAAAVSVQEELDRVVPVVERLAAELDVVISVDTSTAAVITESAAAGANLVNDVRALRRPGALDAASKSGLPVCLMHMQGEPGDMQNNPGYADVVTEVMAFLEGRANQCRAAGIAVDRILIDPGFGFGKTLSHNLRLMNQLHRFSELPYPLLVGVSRKSMIGAVLNKTVGERLVGSIALAVMAVQQGATIVRAHDVDATVQALKMVRAVQKESIDQEIHLQ